MLAGRELILFKWMQGKGTDEREREGESSGLFSSLLFCFDKERDGWMEDENERVFFI